MAALKGSPTVSVPMAVVLMAVADSAGAFRMAAALAPRTGAAVAEAMPGAAVVVAVAAVVAAVAAAVAEVEVAVAVAVGMEAAEGIDKPLVVTCVNGEFAIGARPSIPNLRLPVD